jgi:N-acylneuraminate cytidylyltransferase
VSTNDRDIAEVSQTYGSEIIPRPENLSDGEASSESALLHALDYLGDVMSLTPEIMVFLQATSPLRAEGEIDAAIDKFFEEGADSLFSAGRIPGFAWIRNKDYVRPVNYDPMNRPRTQDLTEEAIFENGSIYVLKTSLLRETGCRLGGKISVHLQSPEHTHEIDDLEDLQWVRALAKVSSESYCSD